MTHEIRLGRAGEAAAAVYLEQDGYVIRERNYRTGHLEVDLIAEKNNELVFVEIKTRRIGRPETAVDASKQRKLFDAADAYIRDNRLDDKPARFDIIAITSNARGDEIVHFQDAFRRVSEY